MRPGGRTGREATNETLILLVNHEQRRSKMFRAANEPDQEIEPIEDVMDRIKRRAEGEAWWT